MISDVRIFHFAIEAVVAAATPPSHDHSSIHRFDKDNTVTHILASDAPLLWTCSARTFWRISWKNHSSPPKQQHDACFILYWQYAILKWSFSWYYHSLSWILLRGYQITISELLTNSSNDHTFFPSSRLSVLVVSLHFLPQILNCDLGNT